MFNSRKYYYASFVAVLVVALLAAYIYHLNNGCGIGQSEYQTIINEIDDIKIKMTTKTFDLNGMSAEGGTQTSYLNTDGSLAFVA